jgi:hypothetical protein
MLDALERLYVAECEHAYGRAPRPDVKVEYEGVAAGRTSK